MSVITIQDIRLAYIDLIATMLGIPALVLDLVVSISDRDMAFRVQTNFSEIADLLEIVSALALAAAVTVTAGSIPAGPRLRRETWTPFETGVLRRDAARRIVMRAAPGGRIGHVQSVRKRTETPAPAPNAGARGPLPGNKPARHLPVKMKHVERGPVRSIVRTAARLPARPDEMSLPLAGHRTAQTRVPLRVKRRKSNLGHAAGIPRAIQDES